MITFRPSAKLDKQALLVAFSQEQVRGKNFSSVPQALRKSIADIVGGKQFLGENGETFPLLVQKQLVLLVGVGETRNINLTTLRCTLRRALLSAPLKKAKEVELILHDQSSAVVAAAIEAVILGTYRWSKYQAPNPNFIENKKVFIVAQAKPAYQQAVTICEGTNLARDLINENADVVTSDYLEKTIRSIIKDKKNVKLEILNRKELKAKGLNLHLAVNQGSNKEPKLIIVQYTGLPVHKNYTALVGKGVTFDTGGLNIKPTGSMETMRTDMSGSAAVIGTLYNTVKLNLRKNVIFVCGIAENAIGSAAYKPGDVFVSYAGKSVEILNTDAEGRLVLADAIAYTVKNYKPSRLIDIATLTGACVVALGHDYTGLVTTDVDLSRQLVHSSNETDDRVWRLPNYPEIKEAVKSRVADIKNVGWPKGAGGAITAAEFLRQFTDDTPWAHLDIAGTAFVDGQCRFYFAHGGTGAGVRLLTHFLQNN